MIIHNKNEFYSQIIDAGYIIFISGQIGITIQHQEQKKQNDKINYNTIDEQTQQSLTKIQHLLEKINLKINNIVKTTIFIKNIKNLPKINYTYKNFFNKNNIYQLPSRSCLEVSDLPNNADIEIDAIAIRQKIQK